MSSVSGGGPADADGEAEGNADGEAGGDDWPELLELLLDGLRRRLPDLQAREKRGGNAMRREKTMQLARDRGVDVGCGCRPFKLLLG